MEEAVLNVGDVVIFTDEYQVDYHALVNVVWGEHIYSVRPPTINLVLVSGEPDKKDPYGRQIDRKTSVPHQVNTAAPGYFWREAAVEPSAKLPKETQPSQV